MEMITEFVLKVINKMSEILKIFSWNLEKWVMGQPGEVMNPAFYGALLSGAFLVLLFFFIGAFRSFSRHPKLTMFLIVLLAIFSVAFWFIAK